MRPATEGSTPQQDQSHGQMIITGGFIVALAIVVVTLSLNLVIFSQDMATRDDGAWERSVSDHHSLFDEATDEALERANQMAREEGWNPDDNEDDIEDSFEGYVENVAAAAFNVSAPRGELVSRNPDTTTEVSWAAAQTVDTEFLSNESAGGDGDWNVTPPDVSGTHLGFPTFEGGDVDDVHVMKLNISEIDDGDEFTLYAARDLNKSQTPPLQDGWQMTVTSDTIYGNDGELQDLDWDGSGVIEVKEERVNGESGYGNLDADGLDDAEDYFLRIENGSYVTGTYAFYFEGDDADPASDEICGGDPGEACDDGERYAAGGLYEASMETSIETSDVSHSMEHVSTPR